MRKKIWITFAIIIVITILAGIIDWPTGPDLKTGNWTKEIKVHQGLDLQGGTHLVYELDTSKLEDKNKDDAIQSVVDVIDRRVNALGVSEPIVQGAKIGDSRTVIVELPGIQNIDEAKGLIGKTAQLTFWEQNIEMQFSQEDLQNLQEQPAMIGWKDTGLSGTHLKKADVEFDQQGGNPYISLEFNAEGAKMFADITKRNLQKPVAIVLDNEVISAPTVQSEITEGKAVITGEFSIDEARNLSKLLNAGALPVPIKVIEQRNIGPTLGVESVKNSLIAGLVGFLLIAIFMITYYRLPGLLAVIALIVYTLIVLALFKLIPVTLTLSGIAGFILSIGMAVDANILIFERMNEEKREGKPISATVEQGFSRAWLSIRDSNVSSLITCTILYFCTTGMIRGFAVTLAIGILVSMFSAITITRTFLRIAIK